MKKIYYHILEYGDYGNIGWQGFYLSLAEANERVDKLRDYFPDCDYQIEKSDSKDEPVNTTV